MSVVDKMSKLNPALFVRMVKCPDCGQGLILFPFGNPAYHACSRCGSMKSYQEVRAEIEKEMNKDV